MKQVYNLTKLVSSLTFQQIIMRSKATIYDQRCEAKMIIRAARRIGKVLRIAPENTSIQVSFNYWPCRGALF